MGRSYPRLQVVVDRRSRSSSSHAGRYEFGFPEAAAPVRPFRVAGPAVGGQLRPRPLALWPICGISEFGVNCYEQIVSSLNDACRIATHKDRQPILLRPRVHFASTPYVRSISAHIEAHTVVWASRDTARICRVNELQVRHASS